MFLKFEKQTKAVLIEYYNAVQPRIIFLTKKKFSEIYKDHMPPSSNVTF